jgi:quinol monooxygenase YgiN
MALARRASKPVTAERENKEKSNMSDMLWRHTTATAVAIVLVVGIAAASQEMGIARYEKMPRAAYAVVAEVRAKPGKETALRQATLPLVAAVRREPNNLLYVLHEDRETPGRFVFYEIFASQADFEAHNTTPHVRAWFARLPELADGGVKVVRMEILGNITAPPK